MDPYLLKIAFRLAEYLIRLFQKTAHQLPGAGHGRIDCNDKILDPVYFPAFQWLDQRHISVMVHAIGIINIVKGIRIYLHLLFHHGKFP